MQETGESLHRSHDAFLCQLGAEFPELADIIVEHVAYYGETLPYLILGDVARYMEGKYASLENRAAFEGRFREILAFFGRAYETAPTELGELIALGLIENMPYPNEASAKLVELLPANLVDELRKQRG